MEPLISVIVPIYGTEKYLHTCVDSIINQTYKNLEIILVDDQSPDRCPEICDKYEKKDKRIKVIHQKNKGLSGARNTGLDICKGEYISFIDSDDWIEKDMYAVMVSQMEKHNASLAICGRYGVYEKSQAKVVEKCPNETEVFESSILLPKLILGQISDFSACDKVYRKELWEDIRFPEGKIYEDLAVIYKVLIKAENVVLCDKPFYNYYHRYGSIVTSSFREALLDYTNHTQQLMDYVSMRFPEYSEYAIWSHIKAVQVLLIKLLSSDKESYIKYRYVYDKYVNDLKCYRSVWNKSNIFTFRDKLICIILLRKRLARVILYTKNGRKFKR